MNVVHAGHQCPSRPRHNPTTQPTNPTQPNPTQSCWQLDVDLDASETTYRTYTKASPNATRWGYCRSARSVPEQVNVQLGGSADSVVVSFLTFEEGLPADPPVVEVVPAGGAAGFNRSGVTHAYQNPSRDRTYYFHFVKITGLATSSAAGTSFAFRVRSGAQAVPSWSAWRTTRAAPPPRAGGETRVVMFGDMGVYSHNNMGDMAEDCRGGGADAILHLGDHAYDMGADDEQRSDGYMRVRHPLA